MSWRDGKQGMAPARLKMKTLNDNPYVEGVLPEAIQQMRKRGIRASYPHKYYYIYGWDYNYNPSRYYWKSTETRDHGFWFPGEPGQHYHFDPDDPNY